MTETVVKPRVRVPALMSSTSLSSVAFRGLGAGAKKPAAEDDDDGMKKRDGESDDDFAARRQSAAEEDRQRDGESDADHKARVKKNRAKRAKGADIEPEDPDDDDDDDDGDDDTDRDDDREASARPIVRRAKARIAAILEHPHAKANLEAALRLALSTSLPRSEACSFLDALPATAAGGGLADRMAQFGAQRPGAGGASRPTGQAAIDALLDGQAVAAGIMPRR